MKFLKSQRGAMFGLDARIALAIFAGLSIVIGASMVQLMKDNRSEKILLQFQKYSDAFDAMQEDLGVSPIDAMANTGSLYKDTFVALYDESMIAAAYRPKWRGPYIPGTRNYDREYNYQYRVRPISVANNGIVSCTNTDQVNGTCDYFLMVGHAQAIVPQQIVDKINEQLDGTGETVPENEGSVRFATPVLYIRIGKALRW